MKNSSSNKSHGTPIKMLMENEMFKEAQSERKSLSVVAQLMGINEINLDQKHVPICTKRKWLEDYPSTTLEVELRGCRQQEVININELLPSELQKYCYDKMEFRDTYEALQKPARASIIRDQWGNCNENQNENSRNAVFHDKIMEEKHLVEEERLKSKEIQDALEVLSSNKDFVLKLLQDPDSIIPKNMRNAHTSPPLQKRHIAVLKPSQKNEKKTANVVRKEQYPVVNKSEWGTIKRSSNKHHCSSNFVRSKAVNFPQPTRIVVLKPTTRMPEDVMAKITPPIPLCKLLGQSGFFGDLGDSEGLGSTSVEKQISQQRLETVSCPLRDESLHSSVSANRCSEESSTNKSETENIEEDGGSFSDSEIVTPNSRPWEYDKRTCSPCSALSFSQASYSPNSSVVMEAKRQLLDRRTSALSNENRQEQIPTPRCSFSLGEMLAITAIKEGESGSKFPVSSSISCDQEVGLELSTSCKTFGKIKNMESECSLGNLSRSKSLPISPSAYEHIGVGVESSIFRTHTFTGPKEVAKAKNDKSSFKEKISSFLFSKVKKTGREKLVSPPLVQFDAKAESDSVGLDANKNVESENALGNNFCKGSPEVNYGDIRGNATTISASVVTKNASLFIERSETCNKLRDEIRFRNYENSKGNQDQPSPTSVLVAPFDDETNDTVSQSSETNAGPHALSRASPIESVARSLSWGNTHLDMPSPSLSMLNKESSNVDCNEEHFAFIQKQPSSALEKSSMIYSGYHSLRSHLDEILHTDFFDWKREEAKFKEKKSKQNLLFNSSNSAVVEAGSTSPTDLQSAYPWTRDFGRALPDVFDTSAMSAEVWRLVKDSIFGQTNWATSACCGSSLMVDRAPMIGGYRLSKYSFEVQEITENISGEMLKDLVGEAFNA